jgi:HEPN domain-containing protein
MGETEAAEWIRFAEDDLQAAKYLLGMPERKLEIICYHCQQCAEKAMKSLYALKDIEIPRTHDFRILASGLQSFWNFSDQNPVLASLQPFAVIVRYPYEIELVPGDEEKAIIAADLILATYQAFLKKHDQ